jgi:TM2 domain-containing membrane protein YozV
MPVFCPQCGAQSRDDARFCTRCSAPLTSGAGRQPQASEAPPPYQPGVQARAAYQPPAAQSPYPLQQDPYVEPAKSKLVAGLLGILLGSLGIHRFYLGYTGIGIAQLVLGLPVGIITCGVTSLIAYVWGLIEGIMILTGSIATDARGRPLKE